MKVKDLPITEQLGAEPNVIELKPGTRYLLHIKAAWPMKQIEEMQVALRGAGLNFVVFVNNADISLYDVSAVDKPPSEAEINARNPLDD